MTASNSYKFLCVILNPTMVTEIKHQLRHTLFMQDIEIITEADYTGG